MSVEPLGIHHVTAVAGDPRRNADFYLRVLGMRLVKRTVNFDVPDTYHLYYGDEQGTPGTILTFFPWPHAPRGRRGTGQATTTSFAVPEASLGWWLSHLGRLGVDVAQARTRFDEECLLLVDPDGLAIELVAAADTPASRPWEQGPVPAEHAIRGLHSVTLSETSADATNDMLADTLGFRLVDEEAGRYRYDTGQGGPGARVDVIADPHERRGLVAVGTVHHVAWRAPDGQAQKNWRGDIVDAGVDVTPIIDRQYFESIYFREPGGVLLEIATDPPGFTKDEPLLELGRALKLPPWLEPRRAELEAALPDLEVPPPRDVGGRGRAGREALSRPSAEGPGLGHPLHKRGDPRTARLYSLAEETGLLGPHLRLLDAVASEAWQTLGKALPVDGAGAGGAALSDLGFHWSVVRGFAVAARAVGLVGHLWEEQQAPMGQHIWDLVEGAALHESPPGDEEEDHD